MTGRPLNIGEQRVLQAVAHWRVEFLGFEGTVRSLAAYGWVINHEYDIVSMRSRFAFRKADAPDGCGFILVSVPIGADEILDRGPGFIPIQRVLADNDRVRVYAERRVVAYSVDQPLSLEEPTFQDLRAAEYYGFVSKTPAGIIVTQDNVQAVLDAIREYQAPIQQDIRKRNGSTWKGTEKVAAQIIAVAA